MLSTINKRETLRSATASTTFKARPETIRAIESGNTPKGDVLNVARAAGLIAAKRTPELIPHCHPIPIDKIDIEYSINPESIVIRATAEAISKTGLEMEALVASSITALTIYDLAKAIDKEIVISETKLISKKGGKSDFPNKLQTPLSAAILVTSDSISAGKATDTAGNLIKEKLSDWNFRVEHFDIVSDNKDKIQNSLLKYTENNISLIITCGGTGIGPRDITVDATQEIIEKEVPGIAEAIRSYGLSKTPYAMLSRAASGICKNSLIINFPGSKKAAQESLEAIYPTIFHVFDMMNGKGH
ncbi:bifunctional molybdenum cofactor biosynthesis protein MoaC/MoaB [bacterium]|nr:bifunctional molybdenum cofactor biosynthesis protein MoaC/MoaB [bacterium]